MCDDDVAENDSIGTTVGISTAAGQDSGGTHTYALISGPGDDDNGSFAIVSNMLQTVDSFAYKTKNTYFIRVQTDDGNGGTDVATVSVNVNAREPCLFLIYLPIAFKNHQTPHQAI